MENHPVLFDVPGMMQRREYAVCRIRDSAYGERCPLLQLLFKYILLHYLCFLFGVSFLPCSTLSWLVPVGRFLQITRNHDLHCVRGYARDWLNYAAL